MLFRMVMAHATLAYIPKSLLINWFIDILFVMPTSQKYHLLLLTHSYHPHRFRSDTSDNRENLFSVQ